MSYLNFKFSESTPKRSFLPNILLFVMLILPNLSTPVGAQVLDRIGRKIERKAVDRANRKIDQTIDKGLDKAEQALDESVKSPEKKTADSGAGSPAANPGSESQTPVEDGVKTEKTEATKAVTFAAYGKYDFVPGEKLIAFEDFTQDQIGDFPAKWNTNATGEIVRLEGSDSKWLAITSSGTLIPEFITSLPENFTVEFDLAASPEYSFYDQPLTVSLVHLDSQKDFARWERFGRDRSNGVLLGLHPQDAGSKGFGMMSVEIWDNGKAVMENNKNQFASFSVVRNTAKVAIWRQKQRIRLYVNEVKVWDLPRAFVNDVAYNSLIFSRADAREGNQFYISNLRLAVGAPDTRHKLLEEGKFVTTGIYFNSGSAVIKPESYGVLKEIANVLNENAAVKVKVIGHTDSDGGAELNLKLSKERAGAVRQALVQEFGIAADRLDYDGKGAAEPLGDNKTSEGKATNRRVEFVKL